MDWKRFLSYIPSALEQELRLRNEYLLAENRILRSQIQGRLQLTDEERKTLAQIGSQLGRKGFTEIATWLGRIGTLAGAESLSKKCLMNLKIREFLAGPEFILNWNP